MICILVLYLCIYPGLWYIFHSVSYSSRNGLIKLLGQVWIARLERKVAVTRIIAGLYDTVDVAEQAIEELLNNQVPGENITMVINDEEEYFVIQGVLQEEEINYDIEDDEEEESAEEIELENLSDILLEVGLAEEEAGYYVQEIDRGRTLVMVTSPDGNTSRIRLILDQYFPVDVRDRPSQDSRP